MAVTEKQHNACLTFLGLVRNPFPMVPDVNMFYHSHKFDTLVSEIEHAIFTRKGFMVLTGEVGLGKTTIGRRLMRNLDEKGIETSLIFNTFVQGGDLLEAINSDFGIKESGQILQEKIATLNRFLLQKNSEGGNCTIIIDDAQNLTVESLELVRLISNLETDTEKLVQVLLIGQPELNEKLESRELRQLMSRVVISAEVKPFTLTELKQYIIFKLNSAGAAGGVEVDDGACKLIYKQSKGNPRKVNVIMDRCLYAACAFTQKRITKKMVKAALSDLYPQSANILSFLFTSGAVALTAVVVYLFISYGSLINDDKSGLFVGATAKKSAHVAPVEARVPAVVPSVTVSTSFNNPAAKVTEENDPQAAILRQSKHVTEKMVEQELAVAENASHEYQQEITITVTEPALAQPKATSIDYQSVASFLAHYELDSYTRQLFQDLKNRQLDKIRWLISQETGFELLSIEVLTEDIRNRYGLLQYQDIKGDDSYLLLWKPDIRIEHFWYGYKGDDIKFIQTILAKQGLYQYKIDGIVGWRLMNAVGEFQRRHSLKSTGIPDTMTVFILMHL